MKKQSIKNFALFEDIIRRNTKDLSEDQQEKIAELVGFIFKTAKEKSMPNVFVSRLGKIFSELFETFEEFDHYVITLRKLPNDPPK